MTGDKAWASNVHSILDYPLSTRRPIGPHFAEERVARVKRFHMNTLYFCVHSGGYAIFPTETAPLLPWLGRDLLAELVVACKASDVRLVAYWISTTSHAKLQAQLHPEWIQRNMDGETTTQLCLASPYREFLFQQLRDVLVGYDVDGVYFDQLPVACYCSYCRALYEERVGIPLAAGCMSVEDTGDYRPAEFMEIAGGIPPGLGHRDLTPFQRMAAEQIRGFTHGVRALIDRYRPSVAYFQSKLFRNNARKYGEACDHNLPEISLAMARGDLFRLDFERSLTAVYAGYGTEDEGKHDIACQPRARTPDVALCAMATGAVAKRGYMLRDFDALFYDPRAEEMREQLGRMEALRVALEPFQPWATVGIVHSPESEDHPGKRHAESCLGVYRLCLQHHLPVALLPAEDIATDRAEGLQALVLPDVTCLDGEVKAALEAFLDAGNGLFVFPFTGTGAADPRRNAAYEWCGCRYQNVRTLRQVGEAPVLEENRGLSIPLQEAGIKDNYWVSLQPDGLGTYLSFEGPYVDVDVTQGTVIAHRLLDSPEGLSEAISTGYCYLPGSPVAPFAVSLVRGGRRTVVLGDLAPDRNRADNDLVDYWLADQIIACTRRDFPIRAIDVPRTMKLSYYRQPESRSLAVAFANWTAIPGAETYSPHHIEPIAGMKLGVDWPWGQPSVLDAGGRPLTAELKDGQLVIEVPRVWICEGVFIHAEGSCHT